VAQLISFNGMPNVPAFQFWATKAINRGHVDPVGFQGFSGPLGLGQRYFSVTCVANTAHHLILAPASSLVTLVIAGNTTVIFEFTETTAAGGHQPVVVANNATAAQVATALNAAIATWATANMPLAIVAGINVFGTGTNIVSILTTEPQVPLRVTVAGPSSGAPLLAVTNNGAVVYGDPLLHRAWRAFVYTGYDPAGVSVFPHGADIALGIWPLTPVIPKAFPRGIVNPDANDKPEG
jgi:hypothetical protein